MATKTTSGSSEPHASPHRKPALNEKLEKTTKDEQGGGGSGSDKSQGHLAAEIRDSHEDLSELSESNFAEYTSLMTAYFRAAESKRPDAIINDPHAEALAGDAGAAMFSFFTKWAPSQDRLSEYMALRTRAIDEALEKRNKAIKQIVILGAGLDSRAYRLDSLASCHVFELDSSKSVMDRKQRVLDEELHATLKAHKRDVIIADLADHAWQAQLLACGFNPKEPTFWLLEGLLYYLDWGSNIRLVKTIHAHSATGSQVWADMCGHAMIDGPRDEGIWRTRALQYGEDEPHKGIFSLIHWDLTIPVTLDKPTELYGRTWEPLSWFSEAKGEEVTVPWFFLEATKPQDPSPQALP